MKRQLYLIWLLFFLLLGGISCRSNGRRTVSQPSIVVTTSYLESAARDLTGDGFEFVRLAPPGMCPGHFDIAPGLIKKIRECHLLLRFDFQNGIDSKILPLAKGRPAIREIIAPEGLCVPESYRLILKDTLDGLLTVFPEKADEFNASYQRAIVNLEKLNEECAKRMQEAGLRGTKVISSGHQAVFCRWLGLDAVAVYSGANATTPQELQNLINKGHKSGVRYVIANLQEGRQMGEALASHLSAQIVVFSNFPDMSPSQNSYYSLVRSNLDRLIECATKK